MHHCNEPCYYPAPCGRLSAAFTRCCSRRRPGLCINSSTRQKLLPSVEEVAHSESGVMLDETADDSGNTSASNAERAASPELDALLGECDARSYAPETGAAAKLPEAMCERARALVSALEEAGQ